MCDLPLAGVLFLPWAMLAGRAEASSLRWTGFGGSGVWGAPSGRPGVLILLRCPRSSFSGLDSSWGDP